MFDGAIPGALLVDEPKQGRIERELSCALVDSNAPATFKPMSHHHLPKKRLVVHQLGQIIVKAEMSQEACNHFNTLEAIAPVHKAQELRRPAELLFVGIHNERIPERPFARILQMNQCRVEPTRW